MLNSGKKILNETKNHNPPPPQVKWSVPYTQTNTNNVNQTLALLQTTGGQDEPNIVRIRKSQRTSQNGTQNVKT
jgi:fructose/tagatose bisphosphate aldolase